MQFGRHLPGARRERHQPGNDLVAEERHGAAEISIVVVHHFIPVLNAGLRGPDQGHLPHGTGRVRTHLVLEGQSAIRDGAIR